MKNNKMIIRVLTILVCASFDLLAQDSQVFLAKHNLEYNVLLINQKTRIDTIHKFAFNAELLDFEVIDQNNILAIIEMPICYFFYQFEYIDDKWQAVKSGQIASNYKMISYRDPKIILNQPISETFKIVNQNKVEYTTSSGLFKSVDVKKD